MDKLVITPDCYASLVLARTCLELCDESGETIGYFHPDPTRIAKMAELYEWAKTAITDEELERARASGGSATTAEVLARLMALDVD